MARRYGWDCLGVPVNDEELAAFLDDKGPAKEKRPGFFSRLFGGGRKKAAKKPGRSWFPRFFKKKPDRVSFSKLFEEAEDQEKKKTVHAERHLDVEVESAGSLSDALDTIEQGIRTPVNNFE